MWSMCYCVFSIFTTASSEWIQLPSLKPVVESSSRPPSTESALDSSSRPSSTESTLDSSSFTSAITPVANGLPALSSLPESTTTYANSTILPQDPYTLDSNLEAVLLQVHQTLIKEGIGPFNHKILFLKKLQDSILHQIWRRSQVLWGEKMTINEPRGENMMSFPSLEGALMTISFLTFAVFLIKIVRQFIQGIQGPNGTVVPVMMPATTVNLIRHKRYLGDRHMQQILKIIDDFEIKYEN